MPTLARLIALAAAILGLQAWVLWRAFDGGALSGLSPWDDCLIALRGLYNLRALAGASSPIDAIARLGGLVIHSPVSDLPVMAGELISRGRNWGPYALNGLVVLFAAAVALVRAARAPPLLFAGLAAALLFQPMTVAALTFLKADWKGGVVMACALYTLHLAVRRDDRRLMLWGAGLLGLAASAKLTAIYGPVLALSTYAAFEVLAYVARPDPAGPGAYLARRRPTLAPAAALVLGPYLAFYLLGVWGAHGLLGYIAMALSDGWTDGLTVGQRAGSYSPFSTNPAWACLQWQLLLAGALALAASLRRRDRLYPATLAALAVLALMQFAPLVVARTSNPEFGAALIGVALGALLISIDALVEAMPRFAAPALAVSVALAATAPLHADLYTADKAPTLAELKALQATYGRIVADVAARSPAGPPTLLTVFEHLFAPFPNLSLLYFERTGALMDVDRIDDIGPATAPRARGAGFVLTIVPAGGQVRGLDPRFATGRDPVGTDRWVAAQPGFVKVAAYPIPGGELHLFQTGVRR